MILSGYDDRRDDAVDDRQCCYCQCSAAAHEFSSSINGFLLEEAGARPFWCRLCKAQGKECMVTREDVERGLTMEDVARGVHDS